MEGGCGDALPCDGLHLFVWAVEIEGLDVERVGVRGFRLTAPLPASLRGKAPAHLVVTAGRRFRCLRPFAIEVPP